MESQGQTQGRLAVTDHILAVVGSSRQRPAHTYVVSPVNTSLLGADDSAWSSQGAAGAAVGCRWSGRPSTEKAERPQGRPEMASPTGQTRSEPRPQRGGVPRAPSAGFSCSREAEHRCVVGNVDRLTLE